MGIDYGSKRVGIAVSDEEGKLAFPKTTLSNPAHLTHDIAALCVKEGVGAIVLGESRTLAGGENPITAEIEKFKNELERKISLPVYYEPEFFTSIEAERIQGKQESLDASAAALILRSFLDRKNRNGNPR